MVRQGVGGVVTGVFGITRFGNLWFLGADAAWTFVRGPAWRRRQSLRSAAILFRSARVPGHGFQPRSRAEEVELQRRLDHLALNPRENAVDSEATVAKEQYQRLLQYAQSDNGLAAKLERDRRKELESYTRSGAWRFFANLGRVFTRGPHVDAGESGFESARRVGRISPGFAPHASTSSRCWLPDPGTEVVWDASAIRRSVESLTFECPAGSPPSPRAARLIAKVFASTSDSEVRFACLRALNHLDVEVAHNELWRSVAGSFHGRFLAYYLPALFQRQGPRRARRRARRRIVKAAHLRAACLISLFVGGGPRGRSKTRCHRQARRRSARSAGTRAAPRQSQPPARAPCRGSIACSRRQGTRLDNFYVRAISLSAPSWSLLDTGRHLQIRGNAEFDRYTYHVYDYLNFFPFYLGYALSHRVDMPGVEVLDQLGTPLLIDYFPIQNTFQSFQLYQRGVRWKTLQHGLQHRFSRSPRELLDEWTMGFEIGSSVEEQMERELIEKLGDAQIQYLDYFTGEFDHVAHLTPDSASQRSALLRIDAVIGRIWTAIQASPEAGRTLLAVVSDHGMNTEPRVYSQGYDLIEFLNSRAGGAHHVVTDRHPLTEYKLKGLDPFVSEVITPSEESLYLKGAANQYPTALLDLDGNERASVVLSQFGSQ